MSTVACTSLVEKEIYGTITAISTELLAKENDTSFVIVNESVIEDEQPAE